MAMRAVAAAFVLSAACPLTPLHAAPDAAAQIPADPVFERRWQSLRAGGYEPLTIPTDWYDPVAPVAGAPRPYETVSPAEAGISPAALAAAAAWAEAQASTALIVARDGRVVLERYWQGSGRDTRFNPQSMSKTVLAMLYGTAIARGEIGSVDDPVSRYVAEWADDPRGTITLSQLLQMASGLGQGDAGFGYEVTRANPLVRHSLGSDFTRLPLSLPPETEPGTRFDYNNQVNQLAGVILERATGTRYPDLLSERLWQPLGLADAAMPLDRQGGMVMTSCCILSRPVDWVRIGQLLADGGRAGDRALLPDGWVKRMISPSPAYRGYGLQVWVGDQDVAGKPQARPGTVPWQSEPFVARDMILLHGHGGQRTYVMPSRGLVIVRAGREWPTAWDDAVLPNLIARTVGEGADEDD